MQDRHMHSKLKLQIHTVKMLLYFAQIFCTLSDTRPAAPGPGLKKGSPPPPPAAHPSSQAAPAGPVPPALPPCLPPRPPGAM